MKQFLFLSIILFSTALTGQDFTTNLQHPNNSKNYDFFTFPNPEKNEVYAVAFHLSPIDTISRNILWKINTATNKTEQVSIPNYLLSDVRDVRDMFYYNNHIFCLKRIINNQALMLQPIALKEKATIKAQFISLSNNNEQYLASKFIEKDFYVFTISRRKRLLKIYKLDLEQEKVDIMEINMFREDMLSFRASGWIDERYYTRVIDNKDFNHPNQLLVNNKIYFEKDKIILLQEPLNNRQNTIYQIDFESKKFERREIRFSHSNMIFNSVYSNDYIYRFSGSNTNMVVEAIDLTPKNKFIRYVSNNNIETLPFQISSPKRISFDTENEKPIIINYRPGKLFRKPYLGLNYRTLGLIEEYDDAAATIYLGYTRIAGGREAFSDRECDIYGLAFPPHQKNYYFVETSLSSSSNATYDDANFKVPNFAKVIAKCQSEGLRPRVLSPTEQRFLVKNEVAGVQIHRLADGFYGTYFNRKTNEFGFKKLLDLDLVE